MTAITHFPRNEQFLGFDFTAYSDKGFLFTPETYLGEYESIGIVTYSITPEANLLSPSESKTAISGYNSAYKQTWEVEEIDVNDATDAATTNTNADFKMFVFICLIFLRFVNSKVCHTLKHYMLC